ncbi:hypothetical protein D3C80_1445810 [compost metagenome]
MAQAVQAGRFAELRGFTIQFVGPQHRHGRAVADVGGRVLLVELIALVALDPLIRVVAVEVHPGCLRGDLDANVQPEVFHAQVLCQVHRDVEELPWAAFADKCMKMLGFPVKHQKHSLSSRDPIRLSTRRIVGKDLLPRWVFFVTTIRIFCNFGRIGIDEALQSSGFYPGHFARHCAHAKPGARYDR